MTYLTFLILFVILPSLVLIFAFRRALDRRWWASIGVLAAVAVVWTTPWDNFLVARRVWWYNPDLVLGFIIGYVPLEEYGFFVLQTVLTGVLLAGLLNAQKAVISARSGHLPHLPLAGGLVVLLAGVVVALLLTGSPRFNYLILTLGWLALIPIAVQWLFGLDILLARWRVWLAGILIPTLWLTIMDSVALRAGTWTIDPAQTTGIFLPGGIIPLEEGLFFLITNTLVVQGLLLLNAPEAWVRFQLSLRTLRNLNRQNRQNG